MIERVIGSECELAIILRASRIADGISFITRPENELQLGCMKRSQGYTIEPHFHCEHKREISTTQEVLYIKSGRVRVDFYDIDMRFLESQTVEAGDFLLLAAGGHGFHFIDEAEIIEVKQGPYAGEADKKRFTSDAIPK